MSDPGQHLWSDEPEQTIICQRKSCLFPKWRGVALLKIHTEQRILFETKHILIWKSLTGKKLRNYYYQTMLCLTRVFTCNVRVYICWYSCILWKSQTWFPSIEINCSVCCSFSITSKYFYSVMLIRTALDALLPFYRIHFSTSDLFSIFISKPVCQFWRHILFDAISAFQAINFKVEVFSQQSKVLINSRPFKILNSLEV